MITYEYLCTNCAHTWEEKQNISDEKIKTCPECKNDTAQRLISAQNGFILKGGGWAKEGYK